MSHFFSLVQLRRSAVLGRGTRDEMRKLSTHGDAYRDHCLMMKLFPDLQQRWMSMNQRQRSRDFVFRLRDTSDGSDAAASPHTLSYYLVSRDAPLAVPNLLSVQTKPYQPQLAVGERVRFQLRANPSVTRSRAGAPGLHGGRHKPNHDVLMLAKRETRASDAATRNQATTDAAAEWLLTRAPGWGLQVAPATLFADGYTQHRLHRGGQQIGYSSIDYTAMAQVTDPALLTNAMLEGVGRKRGFGCGLLLVRRLP